MAVSSNWTRGLVIAGLLTMAAGCGASGPEVAAVSGTVTLDGAPVAGAVLTFRPTDPGGSPSYGGTDRNGYYSLMFTSTRSGAMIGSHTVEIATQKLKKSEIAEMQNSGEEAPPEFVAIPKKYRGKDALTAEVERGGSTIDFALTSDQK